MENTENKYAVSLDSLERGAHVPLDDQVEEHREPPGPDVVGEQQREAQSSRGSSGWARSPHRRCSGTSTPTDARRGTG